MAADVKLKNNGKKLDAIIEKSQALAGRSVVVGYQVGTPKAKAPGEKKPVDVLDVAIFNEFGTSKIPARPFMRTTYERNQKIVKTAMKRVADAAKQASGRPPQALLGELGEFYVALIRRNLTSGNFEANAPSTVKRKGSSKPLVDTGRILSPPIRWVIR